MVAQEGGERLIEWGLYNESNGWSMVGQQSIIFPPINHEGLRITTTSPHEDSSSDDDQVSPLSPLPCSKQKQKPDAMRCWNLLRCKVYAIASSIPTKGLVWLFHSPAAIMLFVLLYLRFRRLRKETKHHLLSLIQEKDEKINKLLQQIAQMNEILVAFHRSKTG